MKLLSSSSVSTSSTTTTTTTTTTCEGNVSTSKVSCVSGMLRRLLLCSRSLPAQEAGADGLSLGVCERSPGVVARLMGLESMPPFSTSRSISRSLSMDCVDSLRDQLEPTKFRNHSFRDPPTFLEHEDENFLILSFESRYIVGPKKQMENEMQGTAEIKKLRRKQKLINNQSVFPNNKENLNVNYKVSTQKLDDKVIIKDTATQKFYSTNILQPIHNSLQNCRLPVGMEVVKSPKAIKLMQDTEGEIWITRRRKKKKKKKCQIFAAEKPLSEFDSEKSSPNSVLDFVETQNSDKLSRLTSSRSRRTLSEELENYRKLKLIGDNNGVENKRSSEGIFGESWKKGYKDENYVHLWRGICRLANRETLGRNWLQEEVCKFEYNKEIGVAIGLEILDHMLEELVDQLVGQHF